MSGPGSTLIASASRALRRGVARAAGWWRGMSQTNKIAIAVPIVSTLVAGVVSIAVVIVPAAFSALTKDDTLGLVDVTVHDLAEASATVDVKVRSTGNSVSYAKRAEIEVADSRRIDSCTAPFPVPSSYTYDIDLPAEPSDLPQKFAIEISQAIEPGKVDRFAFRLGTKGVGEHILGATVYLFRLRIVFNEGYDNYLESDPILAYVEYPWGMAANTTANDERTRDCIKSNARDLADLANTSALRSTNFDNLVKKYQETVARW